MTVKIESEGHRAAEIVPFSGAAPEDDASRLEISFSSELPYRRFSWAREEYFHEVLGHGSDEADLSRLNSGAAPLLTDHDARVGAQVGVVERAWIDGAQGRAVVRFASTEDARAVRQKIDDGILSNVSVGYRISAARDTGETRDGEPVVRVTAWQPYEVSLVAVPADPTVGVGRAAGDDAQLIEIERFSENESETMVDNVTENTETRQAAPAAPVDVEAIRREAAAQAVQDAMAQSAEMDAFAERFDLPGDFLRKSKTDGLSMDEFRAQALDIVERRNGAPSDAGSTRIGMQSEDVAEFSIFNAVRYLLNPSRKNADLAGFELECSRAYSDRVGKEPEGIFIPDEVLLDENYGRTQVTTSAADGGALVPVTHAAGSFIDMLRARMITAQLGARVLSGLSGDMDIPKRTDGATIYFVDEDEDMTQSTGAFGSVPLTPHTVGAETGMTRRMILNASPDIESLVRDDLLQSVAIGVDTAVIAGGFGAKAPTSLAERLTAGKTAFATPGQPTFEEIVGMETDVDTANALMGNLAYAFGAPVAGHLKTTPKFSGGEIPIMSESGTVNGYPSARSNIIPAGDVMFGNWGDLIIAYWSGFDLRVDTATEAKKDNKILRVFLDFDSNIRHLESFSYGG